MTWFANYLLAEPTPATLNAFWAIPEISKGLYVVQSFEGGKRGPFILTLKKVTLTPGQILVLGFADIGQPPIGGR